MSASRPSIVRSLRLPEAVEARIAAEFDAPPPPDAPLSTDALLEAARERKAVALLVTHHTPITKDVLDRMPPDVKLIATVSVGLDHLDVDAIHARGLALTNTPDVLTECNADLAIFLMLAASRRAGEYSAIMRGGWGRTLAMDELLGQRVSGKTLGIIGMGRIGQAVARRAQGFGMTVLYNNRRRLAPELEHGATWISDLREMLPKTQILSLHLPGGPESDSLINAETLALLPRGAIFVNAARGRLVDEDALLAALSSGQLAAAGLDVCRNEPNPDPRLLAAPNVFMTPHVGSATVETRSAMGMLALDNVVAIVADAPLLTPV
ncbi:2-hydroxyacid dehydrogenase [Acetobacter nitrogenifigens]|nr:D-glycerate dehydrogenase [Acetobacter nitrogenifigens]